MESKSHLVQVLLPLVDNDGKEFPGEAFEAVAGELTSRFGGVTAYTRSPAEGRWMSRRETRHDDVIVVEVMVHELDRQWWESFRLKLEATFRQERVVVRAQPIELL